jgi:hypothetical protein
MARRPSKRTNPFAHDTLDFKRQHELVRYCGPRVAASIARSAGSRLAEQVKQKEKPNGKNR